MVGVRIWFFVCGDLVGVQMVSAFYHLFYFVSFAVPFYFLYLPANATLFPILPLLHSLFYIILEKIKSLTLCCKLAYFILYIDIEHFCGPNLLPH